MTPNPNTLQRTLGRGQSIWIDYIERSFIESGELAAWIEKGVRGLTSNPAIFQKALSCSSVYDEDIGKLSPAGHSALQIYEALAIADIRRAATQFVPIYDASGGEDGYVSLEVNPALADDTEATIAEARRLFAAVGSANLMIKIPATAAGIPAITEVIAGGINVNVTLLFDQDQYGRAVEAYLHGIEQLLQRGGDPRRVASVASFFVSRMDTMVDKQLDELGAAEIKGRAAVAYAAATYDRFRKIFASSRWERLAKSGARMQRLLWASTGTKNPAYSDTLYVDGLIGADTVNTVPPATLHAFLDHGRGERTLPAVDDGLLGELNGIGIDLKAVTDQLLTDGVAAFADSFRMLLGSIETKMR